MVSTISTMWHPYRDCWSPDCWGRMTHPNAPTYPNYETIGPPIQHCIERTVSQSTNHQISMGHYKTEPMRPIGIDPLDLSHPIHMNGPETKHTPENIPTDTTPREKKGEPPIEAIRTRNLGYARKYRLNKKQEAKQMRQELSALKERNIELKNKALYVEMQAKLLRRLMMGHYKESRQI